jgi:hypothetical protein
LTLSASNIDPGPQQIERTRSMADENVKNAYPELPVLPFARTTVAMSDVLKHLKSSSAANAVKRSSYVIFRNESGAGKKGVNNNYVGLQADGGRQPDKWTPYFAGTCVHAENMTGRLRRFICFKDWTGCADFLVEKVHTRGLYVGGFAHPYAEMAVNSAEDWPLAYWREWVKGDRAAQILKADYDSLLKLYEDAVARFP